MEDILQHIPDTIVVDDIRNFDSKKTHLFSNIYNGRTFINPYYIIIKI